MMLKFAVFLVVYCVTIKSCWCMDLRTQNLVDQLERSTAINFTTTANYVYHMEMDMYKPGNIIYTDYSSLKTSDGVTSTLIAGNTTEQGYREGRGAEARFYRITGFTQITQNHVVVADILNNCLRMIDRQTRVTSVFSGDRYSRGYTDGSQFYNPQSVIRDLKDESQLLVADKYNKAVRSVDVNTGDVSTFVKSELLYIISHLTQDDSGDLYVIASFHALYRITYIDRTIQLISGKPMSSGYRDSTLLNSRFFNPHELLFIGHQVLLVAERDNKRIRVVDMKADRVSTLDLCSGCLNNPVSLLLTANYLYVGQYQAVQQFIYPKLAHKLGTTRLNINKPMTATPTTIIPTTTTMNDDDDITSSTRKLTDSPSLSYLHIALISSASVVIIILVLLFVAYIIRVRLKNNNKNDSPAAHDIRIQLEKRQQSNESI